MPTIPNPSLIFFHVPTGAPKPGLDLVIEERPLNTDTPPQQGFITRNIFSSLDPYMRGLLIGHDKTTYRPAFTLGETITSACIARVIASDHTDYPAGSLIQARLPLQEYSSISPAHLSSIAHPKLLDNPHGLTDIRLFLGPLGMPGLTAFSSFYEICQPKPGETIFISAASGAVGSLVGQLTKREGMVVIGSVGSDDKVRYIIDELGFDWGFNYKTEDPAEPLKRLAPEGLDVNYDNVVGRQLEVAIDAMKSAGGRISVCGMVSQCNVPDGQKYGVKNPFQLVAKGIKMQGFKQQDKDFGSKWREEHQDNVGSWLSDGAIKAAIHDSVGVRSAAGAFVDMLEGRNFGKTVVKIHRGEDNMAVWTTRVCEGKFWYSSILVTKHPRPRRSARLLRIVKLAVIHTCHYHIDQQSECTYPSRIWYACSAERVRPCQFSHKEHPKHDIRRCSCSDQHKGSACKLECTAHVELETDPAISKKGSPCRLVVQVAEDESAQQEWTQHCALPEDQN